jgi:hypothetical protein
VAWRLLDVRVVTRACVDSAYSLTYDLPEFPDSSVAVESKFNLLLELRACP